jgi:hypothetical protein
MEAVEHTSLVSSSTITSAESSTWAAMLIERSTFEELYPFSTLNNSCSPSKKLRAAKRVLNLCIADRKSAPALCWSHRGQTISYELTKDILFASSSGKIAGRYLKLEQRGGGKGG